MRLLIGIIWLVLSVLCFTKMEKDYESDKRKSILLSILFLIFGIMGVLGFIFESNLLTITAFLIPTALLCIWVTVNMILLVSSCKTPVSAKYIRYNVYSGGKGQRSYSPVFQYYYQGKTYERQTPESFSKRKIERNFTAGNCYDIFINSEKPEYCVSQRKISIGSFLIGLLGFCFLLFYIIIFWELI